MIDYWKFGLCTVTVNHEKQIVVTQFGDGSAVVAAPVPERDDGLAHELGFPNSWEMCATHDLAHSWLAHKKGKISQVLWAKAHYMPQPPSAADEEAEVLRYQRVVARRKFNPGYRQG